MISTTGIPMIKIESPSFPKRRTRRRRRALTIMRTN